MNGRIIKAYIEMKQSQQNTPLIKNKNPKVLTQKSKYFKSDRRVSLPKTSDGLKK